MKYSVDELRRLRPTTANFEQFILDNFNYNGMLMGLPLKEVNGKIVGMKNNLTLEQIVNIHQSGKTMTNNGTIYTHRVSQKDATYFELRLAYTDNIICIDIDGILDNGDCCLTDIWTLPNMQETFLNCTYTLSRNKKLPHFYFKVTGMDTSKIKSSIQNCFKHFKGDLLTNHVWERIDNEMYNYDDSGLLYIHYDDLLPMLNQDILKHETKQLPNHLVVYDNLPSKLLSLITSEYIDNYQTWSKIIWSAKNSGVTKEQAINFSQQGKNFTEIGFENVWNYDYPKYTIGTIKYYAKQSDSIAYLQLIKKQPFVIPDGTIDIHKLDWIKSTKDLYKPSDQELIDMDKLNSVEKKKTQLELKKKQEESMTESFNEEMHYKMEYFEQYHAMLMHPTSFLRVCDREIFITSPKDFTIQYECVNIMKPGKLGPIHVKFTDEWRTNINIKKYNKIDFLPPPLQCSNEVFNSYTGLEVEKYPFDEDVDIDLFTYQLNLLCGECDQCTEYCLNWLAQRVQQPGILPGVGLVFMSEQGVGKNLFFDNFGRILLGERYYLTSQSFEDLVGKFNINYNRLLVVFDEVRGKDGFEFSEDLKVRITAPQINWQQKGIQTIKTNNCAGSVFLSNYSSTMTPMKVTLDDRRLMVMQCSSKRKGDTKYFDDLYHFMTNKQCIRKVYEMLMSRDISKWNPEKDRVQTKIYKDLQSVNIPPMARFLEDMIHNYTHSLTIEGETILTKLPAKELFQNWKNWLNQNGYTKLEYNIQKFGRELSSYDGIEKRKVSLITYTFNYEEMQTGLVRKGYMEE